MLQQQELTHCRRNSIQKKSLIELAQKKSVKSKIMCNKTGIDLIWRKNTHGLNIRTMDVNLKCQI